MESPTTRQAQPLTEANPEEGYIFSAGKFISEAAHWEEGGLHVLRSLEFDVTAGDPDFQKAVDQFVEKAEDLWIYLSGLETITENENETFLKLAPRFLEVYRELERREAGRRERVISINFGRLRQRGEHPLRNWRPSSPASVSQPSPV